MSCPHGNWSDCQTCAEIDTAYAVTSAKISEDAATISRLREELADRLIRHAATERELTEEELRHLISHLARTESWLSIQNVGRPSSKGKSIWMDTQRWLAPLRRMAEGKP